MNSKINPVCGGRVYLVGAGPGDPELLTIKAHKLLERADLVLHDDLVASVILSVVGPHAQVCNVGKRCGAKIITQAEINTRMIEAAREGLAVVRLKGGDPAIFGRLAEELDALTLASVPFEVIPGVTASSAAAAILGISLTDRRKSSHVVIVSGHQANSGEKYGKIDWRSIASHDATLVIYMPGRDFALLRTELLSVGMPIDTPVAIVSRATTPEERHVRTTLGKIEQLPRIDSPAILLIGWSLRRADQFGLAEDVSAVLRQAELLLS
jgi:uroporphyrin-III C-methyltransferase